MEDLVGIGRAAEKLLDVISKGLGVVYRPRAIRREAEARAYEHRLLGSVNLELEKTKATQEVAAALEAKISLADADEQLAIRARNRIVQTELHRQRNVEAIVELALAECPEQASEEPVDEDWLRALFRYGQDVSEEAMQRLWAEMLKTEVCAPGSFSLRALQTLSTLTQDELKAFQKVCSLADINGSIWRPPPAEGFDLAQYGWLSPFGLSDFDLRLLQEAGLLSEPDVHSVAKVVILLGEGRNYEPMSVSFQYPGCVATFFAANPSQRTFEFYDVRLTSVGKQLRRLTNVDFDRKFLRAVAAAYKAELKVEEGATLPEPIVLGAGVQ